MNFVATIMHKKGLKAKKVKFLKPIYLLSYLSS